MRDLEKRYEDIFEEEDFQPGAYGYKIKTLEDRIGKANLPFGNPNRYGQSEYTRDYMPTTDTTDRQGGGAGLEQPYIYPLQELQVHLYTC